MTYAEAMAMRSAHRPASRWRTLPLRARRCRTCGHRWPCDPYLVAEDALSRYHAPYPGAWYAGEAGARRMANRSDRR